MMSRLIESKKWNVKRNSIRSLPIRKQKMVSKRKTIKCFLAFIAILNYLR